MDEAFGQRVAALEGTILTPVVRRALGSATAEVTAWRSVAVHGGIGGGDIDRITGSARAGSEAFSWSVIRKVVRAGADSLDPGSLRFWAREPLAYRSGALTDLPGGLRAPRCYGVTENSDQESTLWLEDVQERKQQWTLDTYGTVARHLGRFNAAYLHGTPMPGGSWLGRDYLRMWSIASPIGANVAAVRDVPDDPRVRRWYPDDMREALLHLWDERDALLHVLDGMPRTLCHMDAFRRNVLIRPVSNGPDDIVCIDWAFVGTGAIGEEIAPLVAMSVGLFEIEADRLEDLDSTVFQGYLAGLADAGWDGDPRHVRLAYAIASCLRYALPVVIDLLDEGSDPWVEGVFGHRMSDVLSTWIGLRRFLFRLADEARGLINDGV